MHVPDAVNTVQRENPGDLRAISISPIGDIEREGEENAYKKIYFLEEEEINVNELGDYLKNILKLKGKDYLKNNSELKRLIRIYDWLNIIEAFHNKTPNSANTTIEYKAIIT